MNYLRVLFLSSLLLLTSQGVAHARAVRAGTPGFSQVNKGVFELGLDNALLVRYRSAEMAPGSEDTVAQLSAIYAGGFTPRYFIMRNFALSANIHLFLEKLTTTTTIGGVESETSTSDTGVLGILMAHYYVRLGFGMFWKPGVGGGGFYGKRSHPVEGATNQTLNNTLSGGAARIDLGMVYFAGEHFNLKAGPDVLIRFGSEKPEEGEATSFTSVDVGFNVGVGYTF
jgi:hypothetical protein